MSCLKQSSCSVHQGTKVSSAEEQNQDILIPQRVSQQVSDTLPKQSYTVSLKEIGYPQQISTFLRGVYKHS